MDCRNGLFNEPLQVKETNYREWFDSGYMWCGRLPNIRATKPSQITNNQFNAMNGKVRDAQRAAAEKAKEEVLVKYD